MQAAEIENPLNTHARLNYGVPTDLPATIQRIHPNAPYRDRILEDGEVLLYEGHDLPRTSTTPDPKSLDQPEFLPSGNLTENGKFHRAAQDFKNDNSAPDLIRVYEKLRKGIWSYNRYFHLVDSWIESDGIRNVFMFRLEAIEGVSDDRAARDFSFRAKKHRRVIPTQVKLVVWKRDAGKCTICGATDELHFDHMLPYSKGGTSLTAENVQLLCARHNIEKSAKIE